MVAWSQPTFAVRPTRRLRTKTTPMKMRQQPLQAPPLLVIEEEKRDGNRSVYFVTLSHPRQKYSSCGVALRAPESISKKKLVEFILAACAEPVYGDARNRQHAAGSVSLKFMSVWREFHKADDDGELHVHDHVALLGFRSFRFLPVKRALLTKFGLASHWSCTHEGYHSAISYVYLPSEKKPVASLDRAPLLWAAPGWRHPAPDECCYPPCTAEALLARRQKAIDTAMEKGKADPRIQEIDVWPLVVRANIRYTDDDHTAHKRLMAYAKAYSSPAMVAFLFKNRSRLPGLINDIWAWETVEDDLAVCGRNRSEAFGAARASTCVCGGKWRELVETSWELNKLPGDEMCFHVLRSLCLGRSEEVPVVVFAGRQGGEGKSFFFSALRAVFGGHPLVFSMPEKANFPMLGVEESKIVFLDEWRFKSAPVGLPTQLLWLEGKPVPAAKPQNIPGVVGNFLYKGSAPIFITTSLDYLVELRAAAQINELTGLPHDGNAAMLLRRLQVYDFTVKMPKPARKVKCCGRCFADLVMSRAQRYAQANNVSYEE